MTGFRRYLLTILCVLLLAAGGRIAAQTVPVEAPEPLAPPPGETVAPTPTRCTRTS